MRTLDTVMRRRWTRIGALAVAAALAVAGCTVGDGGDDRSGSSTGNDGSSEPTKKMRFRFAHKVQTGAKGYDATVAVPAKPLATVKTTTPGLDVELYLVERSDKIASVVFALHNTTDEEIDLDGPSEDLSEENTGAASTHYASDVSIIDGKGLKQYKTFISKDFCLCTAVYITSDRDELAPDQRQYDMAQVAAPPDSVKTVTVRLGALASVPNAKITG